MLVLDDASVLLLACPCGSVVSQLETVSRCSLQRVNAAAVLQLQDIVGPGNVYSVKAVNQEVRGTVRRFLQRPLRCAMHSTLTMVVWLLQVNVILIAVKPPAEGAKHSSQPYSRRDILQVCVVHATNQQRHKTLPCREYSVCSTCSWFTVGSM
jgi:hypothetical protein